MSSMSTREFVWFDIGGKFCPQYRMDLRGYFLLEAGIGIRRLQEKGQSYRPCCGRMPYEDKSPDPIVWATEDTFS